MDAQYTIIKTLDNQPRVLFWMLDEFLLMLVPVFVGLLMGSFLVMLLGFIVRRFYVRLKKRYPNNLLQHKMYWLIPKYVFTRFGKLKNVPASHVREYIS